MSSVLEKTVKIIVLLEFISEIWEIQPHVLFYLQNWCHILKRSARRVFYIGMFKMLQMIKLIIEFLLELEQCLKYVMYYLLCFLLFPQAIPFFHSFSLWLKQRNKFFSSFYGVLSLLGCWSSEHQHFYYFNPWLSKRLKKLDLENMWVKTSPSAIKFSST